MATTAQIEANRRNSKLSTGPKTDQGKLEIARLNSYRHGQNTRTIMPVLPQEDPGELEERIRQAIAGPCRPAIRPSLTWSVARRSCRRRSTTPSGSVPLTWPTVCGWPRARPPTPPVRPRGQEGS